MAGEVGKISYKLILAAIDGSPAAMEAVEHAAMLAKATEAHLKIIYVVDTHVAFQLGNYQQLAMDALEHDGEQGIAEAEALKKGLAEKSKEFVEKGAEVYTKG